MDKTWNNVYYLVCDCSQSDNSGVINSILWLLQKQNKFRLKTTSSNPDWKHQSKEKHPLFCKLSLKIFLGNTDSLSVYAICYIMDIKTLHLQVNMMFYHKVILMEERFWTYWRHDCQDSIVDIHTLHTCTCMPICTGKVNLKEVNAAHRLTKEDDFQYVTLTGIY